jgi:hypothetical protein
MAAPTTRRVLVFAAVALAVFVLAEVGARVLGPYLPEPKEWSDQATQTKAAQIEDLDCVDVVFAGNSMARDGLDPEAFTKADPSGRSAYNAALDAATPDHLQQWLTNEVLPHTQPDSVVVALASFDLSSGNKAGPLALESYQNALQTRPDTTGRIQRWFADHLALVRYRNELRNPANIWRAMGDAAEGDEAPRADAEENKVIGPSGEGLSARPLTYTGPGPASRFLQTELLADYRLDPDQLSSAEDLIRALEQDGTEVTLLALPVTDDFVSLHPRGDEDFEEYLTQMEAIADAAGADFVDLSRERFDDDEFADTHHLNEAGVERLAPLVAERIDTQGEPCGS